jgi:hypothetical protein
MDVMFWYNMKELQCAYLKNLKLFAKISVPILVLAKGQFHGPILVLVPPKGCLIRFGYVGNMYLI